jgi:hypothetical protein
MLAGEHRAAAEQWQALGCPLWQAYALARSPHARDAQECLDILNQIGLPAVRRAVLRDRRSHGLRAPRSTGPRRYDKSAERAQSSASTTSS